MAPIRKSAFLTQTTLSVDDTGRSSRSSAAFPTIRAPKGEDICYATTNRQAAVKAIAPLVRPDAGDRSAQQQQFLAAGRSCGAAWGSFAVDPAGERHRLGLVRTTGTVGLTAGASAPEVLVDEVIAALSERFDVRAEEAAHGAEEMVFKLPRELVA